MPALRRVRRLPHARRQGLARLDLVRGYFCSARIRINTAITAIIPSRTVPYCSPQFTLSTVMTTGDTVGSILPAVKYVGTTGLVCQSDRIFATAVTGESLIYLAFLALYEVTGREAAVNAAAAGNMGMLEYETKPVATENAEIIMKKIEFPVGELPVILQ